MKKIYKFTFILIFILTFLAIFNVTSVSATEHKTLSVPREKQQQSLWCWAASATSVLKYHGTTVSQSAFVIKVMDDIYNVTARIGDVQYGLKQYGYKSSVLNGKLHFDSAKLQINGNKPVLAGLSGSTIGHMVVVRGYLDDSGDRYIYAMDPETGTYEVAKFQNFTAVNITNLINITK